MKFAHTNIISKDWRKLADFYIQVFNCELVPPERKQAGDWLSRGTGVQDASLNGVHLRLPGHGPDGPTLEIYQYGLIEDRLPCTSNRHGYGHIAFEVEDVHKVVAKILAHGGESYGEIVEKYIEDKGQIVFTYIKDPEGNIIELQHWD